MRILRTVPINLAGYALRAFRLVLLAVAVFAALTTTPADSFAYVSIRSEVSYQDNETDIGDDTTSAIQKRFTAILNTDSVFSSKLRMTGLFQFDVLQRVNETTTVTRSKDSSIPPRTITNTSVNNTKSTELQPNIDVRFSTDAIQLDTGYRKIDRDENVVTGAFTNNTAIQPNVAIHSRHNVTTEAVADANIRTGSLPNVRLRYDKRSSLDENDGVMSNDTDTTEYKGSLNYKLGIFSLNADYGNRLESTTAPKDFAVFTNATSTTKTTVTKNLSSERDQEDISGQLSIVKKFSSKVTASARENYIMSDVTRSGQVAVFNNDTTAVSIVNGRPVKERRTTSTSELRLILTPIARSNVTSSYVLRDLKNIKQKVDENIWTTTASYTMARFFRFYGSYTTRETDTDSTDKSTRQLGVDTTILGANFKHRIRNINITARYERRSDSSTSDENIPAAATFKRNTDITSTRTNIDWLIDVALTKILGVSLSEAYVSTDSENTASSFSNVSSVSLLFNDQLASTKTKQGNVENNKFRLKAVFGPIKNLTVSPYIDYTIATNTSTEVTSGVFTTYTTATTTVPTRLRVPSSSTRTESKTTTTEFVVPATYKLRISDNIDFAFTDNYRSRSTTNIRGNTSTSTTNNAIFRLSVPRLTKSTSFSADATFSSSSTDTTSTSSSTYTARLGWNNSPHRLDADFSYQTGQEQPSTTRMGLQYALSLALKKVTLNFQALYTYSVTQGANLPQNTAQTLFMLLSIRN